MNRALLTPDFFRLRKPHPRPLGVLPAILLMALLAPLSASIGLGEEPPAAPIAPAPPPSTTTPEPSTSAAAADSAAEEGVLSFGFWNLENLFDSDDDPNNRGDNEFLPAQGWTEERYHRKLDHLAEILSETQPHILGVCEVENARVLTDLAARPSLAPLDYQVVHLDSPDKRGIDLALLYRAPVSYVADSAKIHPISIDPPTRGVFECRLTIGGHPLAVLVNHWPSRGGGESQSRPLRQKAAVVCLQAVQKIRAEQGVKARDASAPDADVLVIGDFNDDPFDDSVRSTLGAVRSLNAALLRNTGNGLYNPSWKFLGEADTGTLYYNREWVWNVFDQCIVTRGLLQPGGLWFERGSLTIYAPDKMRDQYRRPVRFRKNGRDDSWTEGYSDHLPIFGQLRYSPSN